MSTDNNSSTQGESLLIKTSNLRDDLLIAVAKLEQYSNALQAEVLRLKKIAEKTNGEAQAASTAHE